MGEKWGNSQFSAEVFLGTFLSHSYYSSGCYRRPNKSCAFTFQTHFALSCVLLEIIRKAVKQKPDPRFTLPWRLLSNQKRSKNTMFLTAIVRLQTFWNKLEKFCSANHGPFKNATCYGTAKLLRSSCTHFALQQFKLNSWAAESVLPFFRFTLVMGEHSFSTCYHAILPQVWSKLFKWWHCLRFCVHSGKIKDGCHALYECPC